MAVLVEGVDIVEGESITPLDLRRDQFLGRLLGIGHLPAETPQDRRQVAVELIRDLS